MRRVLISEKRIYRKGRINEKVIIDALVKSRHTRENGYPGNM